MQLVDSIRQRRSIRQFLPKPVPDEVIQDIIAEAVWSPSWGNTQQWEMMVVTGDKLTKLKEENKKALFAGQKAQPEIAFPEVWPDAHKARYGAIGKAVLESQATDRDDKEGRLQNTSHMFSFFDAPVLLYFMVDKQLSLEYAVLDVGLILQNVSLLACDKGLGSCIMAVSVMYADIVRKILPVPDNKRLVIGTALGYPDLEAPINNFERQRDLEQVVTWVT
ncbi:MAG TPA: nitroreductase [Arenicellales bacterium]|nr:nitroreductase [Arenicellales bacterium]